MLSLNKPQYWWQLSSVQIGSALSLPVFLMGAKLDEALGDLSACIGICLGNAFLLAIALISGLAGAWKRKSLAQCASEVFGSSLDVIYSLFLACIATCWFAIQLNIMGEHFAQEFLSSTDMEWLFMIAKVVFGLAVTGLLMIGGIASLNRLSYLALAICFSFISTLIYLLLSNDIPVTPYAEKNFSPLTFQGVSLIIGMGIMGAINLPTYARQANTTNDSIITCILLFGVAIPFFELLGVFFHSNYSDFSLKELTERLLPHYASQLWLYALICSAGLAACAKNIYNGFVSICTLHQHLNPYRVLFSLGFLGTLLSLLNPAILIQPFLQSLSIILTSMGAAIVFELLAVQSNRMSKNSQEVNLLVWGAGILVGILSLNNWIIISEVPAMDAFIATGLLKIAYIFIHQFMHFPQEQVD